MDGNGSSQRLGLVLGAGGEAGVAFHRGVLRALDDLGLRPANAEVVVGTSAGAAVGAGLRKDAAGPVTAPPGRVPLSPRAELLDLARRPRQAVNALLLRPDVRLGDLDLAEMVGHYRAVYGSSWPDAALWVVAVRRSDGRRVAFGRPGAPRADVAAAVAASCAVPGYVSPVRIDGTAYVDGGLHSPTNADLLAGHPLDLVVVSSPMSADPRTTGPRLDLPVRWRFHRFLRNELWTLRGSAGRVVIIEPDRPTLGAMGWAMLRNSRSAEIEKHAHAHTLRRLRAAKP
ncbi:patatin-like phospholipase family protein [Spirillospora sp. NPDC048911]|uniref:patatin-like phospholipase family protein n=1 Tax=Spirillospora sp. NPDC048911 TaxID=3364527 RepID=UPI003716C46B